MKLNEILNMNPIVITSQKPTIHTKIERNEHKHTTKESHQTTREKAKRRKKTKIKNNQKTSNKMTVSTYLSTITLNVNELNPPLKRYSVAIEKTIQANKKHTHLNAAYKLTSELQTHTD